MKDITISIGPRNYAVLESEASRMGVDVREYVYDLVMMDVYRNLPPRCPTWQGADGRGEP